jgi:GAF domain-containing protein
VLDPDELLQAVVNLTKERFGLYHAHIYLADESWNTLLLAAGAGDVGREMVAGNHSIPLNVEKSLVARAAREQQAVIVNDVRSEPDFLPNPLCSR